MESLGKHHATRVLADNKFLYVGIHKHGHRNDRYYKVGKLVPYKLDLVYFSHKWNQTRKSLASIVVEMIVAER